MQPRDIPIQIVLIVLLICKIINAKIFEEHL